MTTLETVRACARRHKLDETDVVEFWTERAAIREYLGGTPRDEAERLAFAVDVIEKFGQR